MAKYVFSEDGNYVWTGKEWIPAPPNKAKSTRERIDEYAKKNDIDNLILLSKELARTGDKENQMHSLFNIGTVYLNLGRTMDSEQYIDAVRSINQSENNEEIGFHLLNLEFTKEFNLRNLREAKRILEKIRKLRIVNENVEFRYLYLWALLTIDFKHSTFIEAMDLAKSTGDNKKITRVLNIGAVQEAVNKNFERAIELYEHILNQEITNGLDSRMTRHNIAMLKAEAGQTDNLIPTVKSLLVEHEERGDLVSQESMLIMLLDRLLPDTHLEKPHYVSALVKLCEKTGDEEKIKICHETYSHLILNQNFTPSENYHTHEVIHIDVHDTGNLPNVPSFLPEFDTTNKRYICMGATCQYSEGGKYTGFRNCIRCGKPMVYR